MCLKLTRSSQRRATVSSVLTEHSFSSLFSSLLSLYSLGLFLSTSFLPPSFARQIHFPSACAEFAYIFVCFHQVRRVSLRRISSLAHSFSFSFSFSLLLFVTCLPARCNYPERRYDGLIDPQPGQLHASSRVINGLALHFATLSLSLFNSCACKTSTLALRIHKENNRHKLPVFLSPSLSSLSLQLCLRCAREQKSLCRRNLPPHLPPNQSMDALFVKRNSYAYKAVESFFTHFSCHKDFSDESKFHV